jgi:hypothetical protein
MEILVCDSERSWGRKNPKWKQRKSRLAIVT